MRWGVFYSQLNKALGLVSYFSAGWLVAGGVSLFNIQIDTVKDDSIPSFDNHLFFDFFLE